MLQFESKLMEDVKFLPVSLSSAIIMVMKRNLMARIQEEATRKELKAKLSDSI